MGKGAGALAYSRSLFTSDQVVWRQMEHSIAEIRQRWFEARLEPLPVGTLIREREGDLLVWGEAERQQVETWLGWARRRRAYIVETGLSRPHDLGAYLVRSGFREVQRQGAYLYSGAPAGRPAPIPPDPQPLRGRGLLEWLRPKRPPARVEVREVSERDLPVWNRVCWHAFAPRTMDEERSLREKQRAFGNLQGCSHWYLAWVDGEPVGTAILYEGSTAGQILAVGTLPHARRRGVARHLVRHAIAVHTAAHATPLFLDTQPGSGAERLYLSLGFTPAYTRRTFAPLPTL
jgi:GNAT superfamily N-acetyltransferase